MGLRKFRCKLCGEIVDELDIEDHTPTAKEAHGFNHGRNWRKLFISSTTAIIWV